MPQTAVPTINYNAAHRQGMRQDFGSAGAGASWRALGLKTAGAHSTRLLKL